MTDRALTEKQVDELADLNELVINGLGRADVCVLIASHRVLQQQVAGLEDMLAGAQQAIKSHEGSPLDD